VNGLALVVDALAAYRLTRLVTQDRITQPLRDRLDGLPGELVRCSWCVGIYAAFGVVAARRLVPRGWAPIGDALAVAAVVGLISENA
jgi:hypothetical protein